MNAFPLDEMNSCNTADSLSFRPVKSILNLPDQTPPAWTARPVLIYGPHKSGSTLLQRLLDGHASMWCYPAELKLKFFLRNAPESRAGASAANLKFCQLQLFEHEQWDRDQCARLSKEAAETCVGLGDYIQRMAWVSWLCAPTLAPARPKLWLAKEVGGRTDPVLNFWRHAFYDGKVVFILRHPLHVVRSIVLLRLRTGQTMSLHRTYRALNDTLRVTWDCVARAGAAWAFPVVYERLTSSGREELLRQLCGFLDVPFEPVLLSPTMLGEKAVVATSSKKTTEVFEPEKDWKSGMGIVHIIWMSLVYWGLNNCYALRGRKWKMRSYTALSTELNRLAGEK